MGFSEAAAAGSHKTKPRLTGQAALEAQQLFVDAITHECVHVPR